ncbi:hypothetical protein LBMAG49_29570 [Planctomycetota bacterium]|nr:hypothetical protein LBMAG49_29570 [Planctomycetota bacterium]
MKLFAQATLTAMSGLCSLLAAMQAPESKPPAAADAGAQSGSIHLRGRIVSWDGNPIEGAAVALAPSKSMTTDELLAKPQLRTTIDGVFDIETTSDILPSLRDGVMLLVAAKGMASIARAPGFTMEKMQQAPGNPGKQRARDTDLKEIVLPDGARLFGRVRDAEGKPLAGADVVARDMLEGHRSLQGPQFNSYCRAKSDAKGIFRLNTTLPNAVAIEVSLNGYFRQSLEPVAIGTPLEITLQRGGSISGRVLDADGRGVAGASVIANYELRGGIEAVRSEIDGRFQLNLDHPARFRLTVNKRDDRERTLTMTSAVFDSARANLELQLPKPIANTGKGELLAVRAVQKVGGEPVPEIRGTAVFEEYANRNSNYLEYRFSERFGNWSESRDGQLLLTPPQQNAPTTGAVRVLAVGYAPATRRDVEWKDLEQGTVREPVTIELVREATVRGRVLDETTGAPVRGAMVWALQKPDASQGIYDANNQEAPANAALSDEDGKYELHQLGEGNWQVRVTDPQRPRVMPTELDLKAEQQLSGLDLKLPAGAVVAGRITGMPIPQGARAFLQELPRSQFGGIGGGNIARFNSGGALPESAVTLGNDGAFRFSGVKLENFMLLLVLPSPPRCGGTVVLPLEPFRVRKDGIQRDFNAIEDQPGTITGTITFPSVAAPIEQLLVIAMQVPDEGSLNFYPGMQLAGPRSFVAAGGKFSVRVGPGQHRLLLLDIATGVVLASSEKDVRVRAGEHAMVEIHAPLVSVSLKFVPEEAGKPCAVIDRIEVRHMTKSNANQGNFAGDNYEQCMSVPVAPGQTDLTLVLPIGIATLFARNNVATIRIDGQRNNIMPLGRAEIDISNTEKQRLEIELRIGAPVEIPDPNANKKDGDEADDDGTDKAQRIKKG